MSQPDQCRRFQAVALLACGLMTFALSLTWAERPAIGIPDVLGHVGDFDLLTQDGKPLKAADLRGKVWIADFIFTRCVGPCPGLSWTFSRMQGLLPKEISFVSFSLDPDYDSPLRLAEYARRFRAQPGRWFLLTGSKQRIRDLVRNSFHLTAEDTGEEPGTSILHDIRFVLIDGKGDIRGYYDSKNKKDRKRLMADAYRLIGRRAPLMALKNFPPLNAALNAACAALLLLGFGLIRKKWKTPHAVCMMLAFLVSCAFLASYLYYHSYHGVTKFQKTGIIRTIYFFVLLTHTFLAAAVPVLALKTFYHALRRQFDRHRRIARWALPLWLYVSLTGVAIYLILYRL